MKGKLILLIDNQVPLMNVKIIFFFKWRHISKQGSEGVNNVQSKTKPIDTFLFSPSQNITYLMKKLVHN